MNALGILLKWGYGSLDSNKKSLNDRPKCEGHFIDPAYFAAVLPPSLPIYLPSAEGLPSVDQEPNCAAKKRASN